MTHLTAEGYMIDVDCDDVRVQVHARSKVARAALTGWETTAVEKDGGGFRLETHARSGDTLDIPRSDIASVKHKTASRLVNGNLVIVTVEGRKYQLHYRHKQREGFAALAQELGVTAG